MIILYSKIMDQEHFQAIQNEIYENPESSQNEVNY